MVVVVGGGGMWARGRLFKKLKQSLGCHQQPKVGHRAFFGTAVL